MKNVETLTRLLDQVNGSMVEAKREIFERGFYHRPVYSNRGTRRKERRKKD